jgi:hypothetical protein
MIKENNSLHHLNISHLALESDSCSVGSIKRCIDAVLSPSRLQRLESAPIKIHEFIDILHRTKVDGKVLVGHREFARRVEGINIDSLIKSDSRVINKNKGTSDETRQGRNEN